MGNCCKKGDDQSGEDGLNLKKAIDGKKKICIWILGGPGSGKGTQCKTLAQRFNLAHLSTGDLLRKTSREDTPLATQIRETMERGGLVDTTLVLQLLTTAMKEDYDTCDGYLIDGYPREVGQGELFCEQIGTPHLVIYLNCPDDILTERLIKRGQQSGRVDDNEETIRLRLQTFHNISRPVVDHWKNVVIEIDGSQPPDHVGTACIEAVQKKLDTDFKKM